MDRSSEFPKWKTQSLSKADLSRKGSVDEDVVELVRLLNAREQFFTTSSCAGRILLLDGGPEGREPQKQKRPWLLVTHGRCTAGDLLSALKEAQGDAVLKFEPFVLHVQCRQLQDAQVLAVRSTHGLEVPLSHEGRLMVTEEYIDFLLNVANQKMEENKRRIERFYSCLQLALEREEAGDLHPEAEKTPAAVYTHRRKRKTERVHGRGSSPEKQRASEREEDGAEISLSFFPENY
ncbi:tRNA wybutosine-synthesizing protein 3 homolog isoform X2 [Petaurus breviceps papuanus]|uniref:tRNA wybutosine-synthesizing protein 3 homolog isoform X2 n=1 Tax=Petaurus breviceps papuanus TaxID=3040969 RepID=UPI0036D821E2